MHFGEAGRPGIQTDFHALEIDWSAQLPGRLLCQRCIHDIGPDGQRYLVGKCAAHDRLRLVESGPDTACYLAVVPHKPDIRKVVSGSGFAGSRKLFQTEFLTGIRSSAGLHDFRQKGMHLKCYTWIDHLHPLRFRVINLLAVLRFNPCHHHQTLRARTASRKHRVRSDKIRQCDIAAPKKCCGIRAQIILNSSFFRQFEDGIQTSFYADSDRRRVLR